MRSFVFVILLCQPPDVSLCKLVQLFIARLARLEGLVLARSLFTALKGQLLSVGNCIYSVKLWALSKLSGMLSFHVCVTKFSVHFHSRILLQHLCDEVYRSLICATNCSFYVRPILVFTPANLGFAPLPPVCSNDLFPEFLLLSSSWLACSHY